MPKVEIYTTSTCPYCHAAKSMLNAKGVQYEEIDAYDPQTRTMMMERAKGRRTVPQIFVGETHVGGYDDMAAMDRAGKLDALLAS